MGCGSKKTLLALERARSDVAHRRRRWLSWQSGLDPQRLAAGIQEDAIKNELRARVEQSIARGVFGAPTLFIDGEMFWGHDRLAQVERWITTGPF